MSPLRHPRPAQPQLPRLVQPPLPRRHLLPRLVRPVGKRWQLIRLGTRQLRLVGWSQMTGALRSTGIHFPTGPIRTSQQVLTIRELRCPGITSLRKLRGLTRTRLITIARPRTTAARLTLERDPGGVSVRFCRSCLVLLNWATSQRDSASELATT